MTHARGDAALALSSVLQRAILLSAVLTTLLFATPLAVAVQGIYRNQATEHLMEEAERLRPSLSDPGGSDVSVRLSHVSIAQPEATELGVYTRAGNLVAGNGPAVGEPIVAEVGLSHIKADAVDGGKLVVVVPVGPQAGDEQYLLRAAQDYGSVKARTYGTWALMAALAAAVLVVVAAIGRARARRIARPLQQLARAADQLGRGDFSVRAVRSGVGEVDAVSINLERTARRLGGIIERERAFSSDASHQLRTPLTAVRIGLESALLTPGADLRAAAVDALDGLDRLEQTVLDLLALARDTGGPASVDVEDVIAEAVGHWDVLLRERRRRIEVDIEGGVLRAAVSAPALRTVLDVLLGNALAHGGGTVRVSARDRDDTVIVVVEDDGPGILADPIDIFVRRSAEASGTGIGLALARTLIEADGGRLELTRSRPATFSVLLPASVRGRPNRSARQARQSRRQRSGAS